MSGENLRPGGKYSGGRRSAAGTAAGAGKIRNECCSGFWQIGRKEGKWKETLKNYTRGMSMVCGPV